MRTSAPTSGLVRRSRTTPKSPAIWSPRAPPPTQRSTSTPAAPGTTGRDARRRDPGPPAGAAAAARDPLGLARCDRPPRRRVRRRRRAGRGAARQSDARRREDDAADAEAFAARPADGHRDRRQVISLDHRVERWVVEHRVSWLNDVFVWISNLGVWGWIVVVVALVAAYLLRRPHVLLIVLAADGVAEFGQWGVKLAVDRPRPRLPPGVHRLVGLPTNSSFPSGHATVAFACAVTIALLVPRLAVPVLLFA